MAARAGIRPRCSSTGTCTTGAGRARGGACCSGSIRRWVICVCRQVLQLLSYSGLLLISFPALSSLFHATLGVDQPFSTHSYLPSLRTVPAHRTHARPRCLILSYHHPLAFTLLSFLSLICFFCLPAIFSSLTPLLLATGYCWASILLDFPRSPRGRGHDASTIVMACLDQFVKP
jgi:hypothetical protein